MQDSGVSGPAGGSAVPGLGFLQGGGALGALMQARDWADSPLGPPTNWPSELKATVALMLPAAQQIVLFWGPGLCALYNDSYAPTIGDKHPHALGRPAQEHWSELWDDLGPLLHRVLEKGETIAADDRPFYIERHGHPETVYFDISFSPVRREDGEIGGVLCLVKETTQGVLAAAQLRASERRFHAMADSIDQMIWSTRPDGFHDYYNQRWYDYTGVPEGSTDGDAWNGMFHPEDQPHAWAVWQRCLETGDPYHIEYRLRHRSGDYRWVLGRAQPVRDESGVIQRWYGTCTDIHELKQAQEQMRRSDERLEFALAAGGGIGTWDWDLVKDLVYADERFAQLYNVDPALAASGAPIAAFLGAVHSDDVAAAGSAIAHARETGAPFTAEYRVVQGDGSIRWVLARGQCRLDPQGKAIRFPGVVLDITDAKTTDAALRDSEERYRLARRATNDAIWDWDLVKDQVLWNEALETAHGHKPSDVGASGAWWIGHIHPDDRGRIDKSIHAVIDGTGTSWTDEYRFQRADGSYASVLDRGTVVRGEDGRAVRMIGAMLDLTRLRDAEIAIRATSERLRLAADATQIGIWDFDLVAGRLEWDDRVRAAFGLSPGAPVAYSLFLEGLHPDDREATDAAVQKAFDPDGSGDMDIEYRTRGIEDGKERWIAARGRAQFENGLAVRFTGTTLDITARKESEFALERTGAELREQAHILETLNHNANELAAQLDRPKVVQLVTDNGVALTGAQFGAFFYNVMNAEGESYMLYALSGATPDQFDFGMPRNTPVFHATFSGEGVVRVPDITLDPRYGKVAPHFGMPKGHLPVRSYLAVPVTSASGEVIGGLFFGHEEAGRFDERHEALITGIAAQAATAMDNARLYEAAQTELASRMKAEQELRLLNETLEQRVAAEVERRNRAEDALRQAQKMETLGQLTGGVAHDFNNLLQIVSGNIDLIQRGLPQDSAKLRRAADNAARGAERAAVLTQRLLAFSRRQPLAPKPIDPNKLVGGMSELLHRTLGETIEVETVLTSGLWPVEVDAPQLENAILNLAVNARDAMPDGGKLTIETCNTHLDRGYVMNNAEVMAGQYVCICVTDSGGGMDEATVARAFEPFFTTKEVGKGTGLGLSMVYGFVKQSGGHLKIYSEPGEGTTVKIYLPRLVGAAPEAEEAGEELIPEGAQNETILVCEDDEDVRAYTVEVLRELGYRVLEAGDGPSALRVLEREEERIDFLFTDVVLPQGMTGAVLAERARGLRPDLKVLFTTGYARNAIVHHGRLDAGVELITKPFSYADLAARVRDMLDGQL